MRRRLVSMTVAALVAATVGACSSPPNQPCFYHNGVEKSYLTPNGSKLLLVCKDGTVIVRHP